MELGRFHLPFSEDAIRPVVQQLPHEWLRSRRWFAEKSRRIERISLVDHALLSERPRTVLALLEVTFAGGGSTVYVLPLLFEIDGSVTDALENPDYQRELFAMIARGAKQGPVRFEAFVDLPSDAGEPRLLGVEQSNTSIAYGREWILKSLRKLAYGQNRDLEVGRFLTSEARFAHTPQVVGAVTYREQATLGVLQRFVANQGDGWSYVQSQLQTLTQEVPNAPDDLYWAQDCLPDRAEGLLQDVERLGHITGEMHQALSSRPDISDFAPEPCSETDPLVWIEDLRRQRSQALQSAEAAKPSLSDEHRRLLDDVLVRPWAAELLLEQALAGARSVRKIQIHGDYHLGQVLKTAESFVVIDFEGEPARPLEERRAKQPALRDVAGMLRSLDYAAWAAVLTDPERVRQGWAEGWARQASGQFLAGWRAASGEPVQEPLLALFQLSKAFYELNYELNNRPDWLAVPLRGIAALQNAEFRMQNSE